MGDCMGSNRAVIEPFIELLQSRCRAVAEPFIETIQLFIEIMQSRYTAVAEPFVGSFVETI